MLSNEVGLQVNAEKTKSQKFRTKS